MSEFYEEKLNDSTYTADRYKHCKVLIDKETKDVLLATRELDPYPPRSTDIYHRLGVNEVNRLDILAYNYYKNPQLWWVIAQANDIADPFQEMRAGDLIRVPSLESLYRVKILSR